MFDQLYDKWLGVSALDATIDWCALDDDQLDGYVHSLRLNSACGWDDEYPKGYVKLCGAQKEWLARRFDNWNYATFDPRLNQLNQPCNATDEKRARMGMSFTIGATSQIIGQEWGRMKRKANGMPVSRRKTPEQLSILEAAYEEQPYPDSNGRAGLAQVTGLTPVQVNGWFGHQREVRGLIAASNAEFICQPPTYVTAARARDALRVEEAETARERARDAERSRWEAEAVASRESARAAQAEALLQARHRRELSVHGEDIGISPGISPGQLGAPQWTSAHGAVLDTGNSAVTMVSAALAARTGLAVDPAVRVPVRGINGLAEYPTARARVRVRDQVQVVRVAVGGAIPLLVGLDVIDGLFEAGYVLSRSEVEAAHAAAAAARAAAVAAAGSPG